ncbi:MAG: LacI family DNA-binding transcriptional regulator [Actinomycetota bacterium]
MDAGGRSGDASPRRASIRDVAAASGVSMATVSHAMNGTGRVEERTKKKIVEVARALGYRANPSARSLRGARTGMIALTNRKPEGLAAGLTDLEYFFKVLSSATSTALAHGYCLVVSPPIDDAVTLDGLPMDGAILVDPLRADPLLPQLEDVGITVVTVGRDLDWRDDEGWWVDNDIDSSVTDVLNHAEACGARRVGLLSGPSAQSFVADTRSAYVGWVEARGNDAIIAEVDVARSEDPAFAAAQDLLRQPQRPDAVYAEMESFALRALAAAQSLGLRVPEDVRIAAGSDSHAARTAVPPITALDLHPEELGRAAVEMLIGRIEGAQRDPVHVVIPTEVMVRDSTLSAGA